MATEKAIVSAVVPPAVKAELERRALEGDRTLSAEIRRTLVQAVDAKKETTP